MPNMRGDYVKNPVAYCALHHFVMRPKDMTRRACIEGGRKAD